ncbi:hypothetical protein TMatcc_004778 [Talaromyces marneffei ATCC 18224]|uniref:RRM domain-containing protein n=1 Tax=Talaromyces marneffei (strain ATCC 18224 / CBS 334.59 / QM 7333) TaxID=441960 RepID=B6Q2I5_TALMQ|nr:conserved hypothetical protein [Talaromyces marneffei ATCC 18224]KAE8557326.1 hypothetical protein EYB25_002033 [Talaromyces marneffei]
MYCQVPGLSARRGPFEAKGQSRYGAGPYMLPSMRNQIFAAGSQFTQANHQQYHAQPQIQPQQQANSPLRNQVNHRQVYGHQMEQFLNEQRKQIQQQMEQRMAVQRKIDQQNTDKFEVSQVQARLGNEACKVQNFPFKDMASDQQPKEHGIVKISNLPYAVTRHEIHQLMGRHAGILGPDLGGGIHIIMERSTAKTMDAFVEFETQKDAEAAARRLSFTESGRYPRLGTRHVDITLSSQDELLHDLFPRAKCVEWQNGMPKLLANADPYSAGFQGFLTNEEIRGLVSHALVPARSPFTERCRQRTYECLISTLWKFPWFATSMYTVADRDELYQAAVQQILELCERVKQCRIIGLNESLLVDLLRAGVKCPAFNERQKFCLIAAAEMPAFSPIVRRSHFEFWPFDCLAKDSSASEYDVMYYAQLTRKALGTCDKDNLIIPNNWQNRAGLMKESPWGHLWIEWNFHNKITTFEDASKVELQLASDLIRTALNAENQNTTQPFTEPMILSSPAPAQHILKHQSVPIQDPWVKDATKREVLSHDSASPQFCDPKIMSNTNSDDDESLTSALQAVRLRSGTSSTFSGAVSQFSSSNGSLVTNESDIYGVSLENKPRYRHQHSQSVSAAVPLTAQPDLKGSVPVRRRGSISIPPTIQSISGFSDDHDQILLSHPANRVSQAGALFSADVGVGHGVNPNESHNVNTLMLQHGIWSTTASDGVTYAAPNKNAFASTEADNIDRGGRPSRHASNPSVSSQQRGLSVLSEDEEDVVSKNTAIKS